MPVVFPIDDVVDVILTVGDKIANSRDFGTPLILGGHNLNSDVYREYTSLTALASDGFISGNPIYETAKTIFSGNAKPKKILVGRRTATVQSVMIPSFAVTPSSVFGVRVVVTNASTLVKYDKTFSVTYSVPSLDTAQEIATQLAALIEADTDIGPLVAASAQISGGVFSGLGYWVNISPVGTNPLQVAGTNASSFVTNGYSDSITTTYDAIVSASNNAFFFILTEGADTATNLSLAAIAEANGKMFIVQPRSGTETTDVVTSSTTDVASTLKNLGYNNTILVTTKYTPAFPGYAAAALVGSWASVLPGADTLKAKTLIGVSPSDWTQTEVTYAKNKNSNVYITRGGSGFFEEGVAVSGRFADVTRGMLWLEAKLEEDVFNLIKQKTDTGKKVPYTDAGVQMVAGVMEKRLDEAVRNGFLASYKVFPPLVETIPTNDRANRVLPDIPFEATLAGAFHFITVRGYLQV